MLIGSLLSVPSAHAGLFAFSTHTFTPCSATGPNGPSTANCTAAYGSTTWASNSSYFSTSNGKQIFTVPSSGLYRVTIAGAAGGEGPSYAAGKGAVLQAEFTFTQGNSLTLLVGQMGLTGRVSAGTGGAGGGGGGSYLFNTTSNSLLLAAGGGGGGAKQSAGLDASTSVNAVAGRFGSTGGTLNAGGSGVSTYNAYYGGGGGGANSGTGTNGSGGGGLGGGGGAGYAGNGGSGNNNNVLSYSFTNGGVGSYHTYATYGSSTQAAGGFGGGGNGSIYNYVAGGGGGGGYTGGGGGNGWGSDSYAGGGGGGGGSFISGSNQTSAATNNSDGYITITLIAPSVNAFAPRLTITNSSTLTYDLTFSESVTGLTASDFSLTGTGSSSCAVNTPSGSSSSYVITVSGCSPGTVILTLSSSSVSSVSLQAGPISPYSAAAVMIDQTAPTIASVAAPSNSTYIPGNAPTFTTVFSESVTVTGTPRLTLTVGSATKYANFLSMSDSKTALFAYTVGSDSLEFDTNGIAVATSLDLNSGSIADLATNSLTNLSFTAPTLTSVLVAQPAAAPTIDSVTATSGQLAIYFTPGAARGSTTTTYQYSSNGGAWTNRPTGTTASPLTLTGLTNGTGYTIRLRATTNAGAGDSSTAVTETPTSISITGDSSLTLTYGNSVSTSAYSASGGTNTFSWSLGSSLTGVSLSGTTVTAGATTPAGSYSQSVRATDGNSQVGTKTLTITVNKASTSITIALPNSSSSAALGGAVVITATVPRAGAVNFMLGGTTISGCGSAAAASTSATCSWTPNALGSVSLTATFTPTDISNYETSTTTTLSVTVVNGVSTVTLSLTGGTVTPAKGQTINIIAAVDQAGRVTFLIDGKRIPGCTNRNTSAGSATCSWKPAVQKQSTITARLVPTNNVYNASTSTLRVQIVRRSGARS